MSRHGKLLERILRGKADSNIQFDALRRLLKHFGFDERIHGSHHIFRKLGVEEKINLQRDGPKAKAYQVGQVRRLILKYQLGEEE